MASFAQINWNENQARRKARNGQKGSAEPPPPQRESAGGTRLLSSLGHASNHHRRRRRQVMKEYSFTYYAIVCCLGSIAVQDARGSMTTASSSSRHLHRLLCFLFIRSTITLDASATNTSAANATILANRRSNAQ